MLYHVRPSPSDVQRKVTSIPMHAFSLIEVVLALGIIAFALVGIMGLFPVAMKSAQESQRETRATLIAQQLFSSMKASPPNHLLLPTGTNMADSNNFLSPAPTLATIPSPTPVFSYNEFGQVIGSGSNAAAIFLGTVYITPATPVAGLSRVQVDVETPLAAPPASRSKYSYVTLMSY